MAASVRIITRASDRAWLRQFFEGARWGVRSRWQLCLATLTLTGSIAGFVGVGGYPTWAIVPELLIWTTVSALALLVVLIVVPAMMFLPRAARRQAILVVAETDAGWGCVTARCRRRREGSWHVETLLSVPRGSLAGPLAGRSLIRWADQHRLTLTATARDDELARHYQTAGFVEVARTWTPLGRKPQLKREPRRPRTTPTVGQQ